MSQPESLSEAALALPGPPRQPDQPPFQAPPSPPSSQVPARCPCTQSASWLLQVQSDPEHREVLLPLPLQCPPWPHLGMELTGQEAALKVPGGLFPPPPHPAEFAHLVSAPPEGGANAGCSTRRSRDALSAPMHRLYAWLAVRAVPACACRTCCS